ncbi:MAG: hypothetical protein OXJ62_15520, partial [Spirochaetaceae bacterium]|nr:hypothetical protein [Spirochaetaceae bacterium]
AGAARVPAAGAPRTVRFPVAAMSDGELAALSEARLLALSRAEMQAIREYFRAPATRHRRRAPGIGAAPTERGQEILSQTWSEHSKHNILKAV